jgi:hypothetical protein
MSVVSHVTPDLIERGGRAARRPVRDGEIGCHGDSGAKRLIVPKPSARDKFFTIFFIENY